MNVESAINLQGMVVTVGTTTDEIMFKKADQFDAEMANNQMVYPDGVTQMAITVGAARRAWMHRKLDNWIDGVEE